MFVCVGLVFRRRCGALSVVIYGAARRDAPLRGALRAARAIFFSFLSFFFSSLFWGSPKKLPGEGVVSGSPRVADHMADELCAPRPPE